MKEIKKIIKEDIGFGTGYDEEDLLEYMELEVSMPLSTRDQGFLDKYKNKMKELGLN
jgi:hypothetical protein